MSWICPDCDRELRSQSRWHNCVRVSIDDLFKGKDPELMYVFDKILAEVADWEDTLISTTQNCIVFVRNQGYLIIKALKTQLNIKIYSAKAINESPITRTAKAHAGKYENHFRLHSLDDLTSQIFLLIRKSYNVS